MTSSGAYSTAAGMPLRCASRKNVLAGEMLRDESQRIRAGLVDRRGLRVRCDGRDEDTSSIHSHLQEEEVLELVAEAQLDDPFAQGAEFARPSRQGADHRTHRQRTSSSLGGVSRTAACRKVCRCTVAWATSHS